MCEVMSNAVMWASILDKLLLETETDMKFSADFYSEKNKNIIFI